jgi:hypothetical protein
MVLPMMALPALAPGRASASGPDDADGRERQRTTLYAEGVALANAGRWDEAVKRFRQVVAIRSAPAALFTLAQAEEHLGQLASAERSYEGALAAARASGQADVADAAARALSAITTRVPSIVVRLERPVPGATATIDAAAASLGEPVKVDPGPHVVAIEAPDHRPFEARVRIAAGQSIDVPAALEPLPPVAPTVVPPRALDAPTSPASGSPPGAPEGGHALPVGPLILGGSGIAVGVVGLVMRLTGQSSYDGASARCVGGVCPTQSIVDDGNSARSRIIVGTVLLGAGIVALAGAGGWWLTWSPSPGGASASVAARF